MLDSPHSTKVSSLTLYDLQTKCLSLRGSLIEILSLRVRQRGSCGGGVTPHLPIPGSPPWSCVPASFSSSALATSKVLERWLEEDIGVQISGDFQKVLADPGFRSRARLRAVATGPHRATSDHPSCGKLISKPTISCNCVLKDFKTHYFFLKSWKMTLS